MLTGFPKFFHVDFLVPGVCGHSLTVSSVGAGAGAGLGASFAGACSAISAISSFLSENTESDSQNQSVHWVMSCNGEAMLPDCGVTLYSYRPEIHGFPSLPALSINFLATPTILSTKPLDLG